MKKARFSKAAILSQLRGIADDVRSSWGFEEDNGCAQLWPRGCDDATKDLIDRAIAYGRWRAFREIANDIWSGDV